MLGQIDDTEIFLLALEDLKNDKNVQQEENIKAVETFKVLVSYF